MFAPDSNSVEKHLFKLKLTAAFARAWPRLFSRTGLSNLLNKMQFTFEVVPCLILSLFRRFFKRCASILAQRYKEVGGCMGKGGGWGERWQKPSGEDTGPSVALRWS